MGQSVPEPCSGAGKDNGVLKMNLKDKKILQFLVEPKTELIEKRTGILSQEMAYDKTAPAQPRCTFAPWASNYV